MEGKDLDGQTPTNKWRRLPCGAVFLLILDGVGLAEDEEISVELRDPCVRVCVQGKWAGDMETLQAKLSDVPTISYFIHLFIFFRVAFP